MNVATYLMKMKIIIKMEALKNMYKSMAQTEKMAAIENVADPKIIADGKIMAELKIKADPKILADEEIPAATEKQVDGKTLTVVEISAPSEIPTAIEKPAELEKQAARLLFRLGRISNCWLLPGPADEHVLLLVDVMNLACSLQVRNGLLMPSFYVGLSPIPYWLFVLARYAKKWLKFMRQPKVWIPRQIT